MKQLAIVKQVSCVKLDYFMNVVMYKHCLGLAPQYPAFV